MSAIKISLLENSYGFLNEAVNKAILAEEDIQQWKFAIFSLTQSIELALKEILRRENPVFIYTSIDKPKHTVSLLLALDRLKNIVKKDISTDDVNDIEAAVEWRNRIVHFEIETTADEMTLVFSKLFGCAKHILNSFLEVELADIVEAKSLEKIVNITKYGEELYDRAVERFKKEFIISEHIWNCRNCGWDAFVIQDDINTCYICGCKDDVVECDDCHKPYLLDDTEELEILHGRRYTENVIICWKCHRRRLHDEEDRQYYEDFS